jgi:DNA repair exonuclease SbcCD ATPase subunit
MTAQLRIRELTLENFRSFRGEHLFAFDRNPGLYYVTGRNLDDPQLGANGAGKSTLLTDALLWVFFDKTTRDSRPADSVTPWESGKLPVSVAVQFERGGERYGLERQRRPNKLSLNGRIVDQIEAEKALGMNEEMFRRTIVLGQFGSLFMDLKPEAQSQMFTQALSLDVWLDAAKEADARTKEAKGHVGTFERELVAVEAKLTVVDDGLKQAKRDDGAWADKHDEELEDATAALEDAKAKLAKFPKPKKGSGSNAPIEEAKAKLRAAREDRRRADAAHSTAKAKATAANNEVDAAGRAEQRYKDALQGSKCPECGQKVSQKHIEEHIDKAKAAFKAAAKALTGAALEEDRLLEAAEAAKLEEEALAGKLDDLERSERERQAADAKAATAEGAVRLVQAGLDRIKAEVNPHKARLAQLAKQATALEEDQAKAKAELTKAQALQMGFEYWSDTFKLIRLKRLDDALRELEMTTTGYAEALGLAGWGIRFATERENKAGETSVGFSIMLYPPDQEEPVRWASYSGGEAQRWQLAVAFALSEILLARAGLSPNIEVYDEPTRGMSPEGVEILIEQLRERALAQGKAIYLVDHHSFENGLFDGTLCVTKKDGRSAFSWN